jgi:predicted Zn-dependent protease
LIVRERAWAILGAILAVAALGTRCAVNPATGEAQLALLSESEEIALGRESDAQVRQSMGEYRDEGLRSYLDGVGRALASRSERPQLAWTFAVVDDPAVNAFALPGGFIYVTRGILAHMSSEGELAGVLGHEIGHVTARHSVEQLSRTQLAGLGLLLGRAVVPELEPIEEMLQAGLGLLFLKYSRDAERQADELGVRYMRRAGYEPRDLLEVLGVLDRVGRAQGGSALPDWLSTHPSPSDRIARIRAAGAAEPAVSSRPAQRDAFSARLQGLVYGADPREGYFEGELFFHPTLQIQIELPPGWKRQNRKDSLQAASPDGSAALVLTLSGASTLRGAADDLFARPELERGEPRRRSLRGLEALEVPFAAAPPSGGRIRGRALFVEDGQRIYQLLGYARETALARALDSLDRSLASFGRLREACRGHASPASIEIVRASAGMTAADLQRDAPPEVDTGTLALLNHVDPGAALEVGRLYKRVRRGRTGCEGDSTPGRKLGKAGGVALRPRQA